MDPRLRKISLRNTLSAIADLAMPRVCVVCGTPLIPQEKNICTGCLADLPRSRFSKVSHNSMADSFNAQIEDTRYCYGAALYYYSEDAGYKKISQSLKYRRDFSTGRMFGSMMGEELSVSPFFEDVDVIAPVPLHWTRKWKRGYNQAEIIGKKIAQAMGCPMNTKLLKRKKITRTQTKLRKEEKRKNVENAFKARYCGPYRHILLIDDVFTTGSTLAACHSALRKIYGTSTRISIATLGFVSMQG